MLKKLLAGMFQPELDSLKAEYERKLADQGASHEQFVSSLRQSLSSAEQERDQIKPELEQSQARNRELEATVNQLQEQINSTTQAMNTQSQEQMQGFQTETDGLNKQIQQLSADLEWSKGRVSQLETEQASLQALLAESRSQIEALESEKTLLQVRTQLLQQEQASPFRESVGESAGESVNETVVKPNGPDADGLIRPPARSKKKVLIVDDAATTRILQKNMLESAGYEVVMGNDGQQGQSLLSEHLPDLVITDVEMPKMNGFELTTWIKQSPYREVPVLMVTSHGDEAFHQKGLQAGADGFVEKKSFNQKTFLEIIQHYV